MIVKSLCLENFRNHKDTKIQFSDSFNIIYGNNGQGKTNILEAIYLCASGRSHRTSKDSELVLFGSDFYNINTFVLNSGLDKVINIKYLNDQKKQIMVNEIPLKKLGSLMGNLYAVIFSPEDLFVVKQGPGERRRFVDITLSQIRPSYFYNLQQLARILKQRNILLKNIYSKNGLMDTIDIWNIKLAEVASNIILERRKFAVLLSELAQKQHRFLTTDKEIIAFDYNCSFQIDENSNKSEISDIYLRLLEKGIDRDIAIGYTSLGPHRDDYDISINNKSLKLYGSQGQQRSSVLSLKIAEIELINQETGQYPILLLDDVMSELDENRQKYLMNSIKGVQTFITCTNAYKFSLENIAKYFKIENGSVIDIFENENLH
ncbi:DNA replication and repair protein RecF [Ruminiclostridium sufflavum DSM 19573]|uniref:DNA replication and repair protein RecF n=1 Tax=Ruminiclostridium sufflavum DSM 19573 TaxID=1121337 RepID=A0A318XMC2_9FIRM|nr:DNA replication/repair protein RecF [Ruminiclostridium sufflavum]PYG88997.1 DNA replication and repair protein RecF [Ruminiclostridium sufflavum DSM 19573]